MDSEPWDEFMVQVNAGLAVEGPALERGRELIGRLSVLHEQGVVNDETEAIIAELKLLGLLDPDF